MERAVKVVVTGASGQLGHDLQVAFADCSVVAVDHATLDVSDRDAVLGAILTINPDVVVHAAAWTDVDGCEGDQDRAWRVNALGSRHVAEACSRAGAYLCAISTDYVFDGRSATPYVEWDRPNPLSVYGRSKLGGEQEMQSALANACIVRTSWLCGAHGTNFVKTMLRLARGTGPVAVVADQRGCPTLTADLAGTIRTLASYRLPGVFHVTNAGPATWYDLAREVFVLAGCDGDRVVPITTAELDPARAASRPENSVLDNAALRGSGLPTLPDYHESLERLVKELS